MSDWRIGIAEVLIRNFRGIEDLKLSFRQPNGEPTRVCVIAGPNGCGKTTVLEACLLAIEYPGIIRGARGPRAIRRSATDYEIVVEYFDEHSKTVRRGHAMCDRRFNESTIRSAYFSSWRSPKLAGSVGITLGSEGPPKRTESSRIRNIKQSLVDLWALSIHSHSLDAHSARAEMRFTRTMTAINEVWKSFFPNQHLSIEPVSDEPEEGFEIFAHINDERLPIDLLSSGQLEIFMFAGGLATEKFDHGIIVIDEPELHLDPQWHRVILRALLQLKPNCQFIVGTHSPEIFDSVMSFERHFLVPDDDPRANAWKNASTAWASQ
jgi:energy-coupling factor transporter ATP-binding protein EcfA2